VNFLPGQRVKNIVHKTEPLATVVEQRGHLVEVLVDGYPDLKGHVWRTVATELIVDSLSLSDIYSKR